MKYRDILGFSKKQKKKVIKEQYGDRLNEGPAYDYAKQWDNVKKTYGAFWDSVHDLEDLLQSKGMGRDAKKVNQMYKKNVEGFYKFIYKLIGKLM